MPRTQNPTPELAEVIGGAMEQRGFTPVLCIRTAGGMSEAATSACCSTRGSGVVFAGGQHATKQDAPPRPLPACCAAGVIPAGAVPNASADDLDFPCVSTGQT